jgi:hypothetical protein
MDKGNPSTTKARRMVVVANMVSAPLHKVATTKPTTSGAPKRMSTIKINHELLQASRAGRGHRLNFMVSNHRGN